ncbi:hypothetical protein MH216_20415, partial [Paenibacillus larvae]|uniref:hypothetical protein n=1 Tax=Paenibacillus larvae TaxID=1464 RepID=UPI00227FA7E8
MSTNSNTYTGTIDAGRYHIECILTKVQKLLETVSCITTINSKKSTWKLTPKCSQIIDKVLST